MTLSSRDPNQAEPGLQGKLWQRTTRLPRDHRRPNAADRCHELQSSAGAGPTTFYFGVGDNNGGSAVSQIQSSSTGQWTAAARVISNSPSASAVSLMDDTGYNWVGRGTPRVRVRPWRTVSAPWTCRTQASR